MVKMGLVISLFFDDPRIKSGFSFKLGISIYSNVLTQFCTFGV